MRNVIVFATDWGRFAVELRWVREVITLGHVTPVPGAPVHIAGAINVRGTITPVIDVGALRDDEASARDPFADTAEALFGPPPTRPPRSQSEGARNSGSHSGSRGRSGDGHGDGAVLLDVEDLAIALRIVKVDEVATVGDGQRLPAHTCAGAATTSVVDSRREQVPLIDPPELVRISLAAAHALAGGDPMSGFRADDTPHGRVSGRISTEGSSSNQTEANEGDDLFR